MNGGIGTIARRRRAARLACVQALYEIDVTGVGSDAVLDEFVTDRWVRDAEGEALPPADVAFLNRLVRGVCDRMTELDGAIVAALSADRSLARLEVLLRAVLRAATYELLAMPEVPAKVIINEYMDVAHAFFGGSEPALVNGVLDRIAREHRAGPVATCADDESSGTD